MTDDSLNLYNREDCPCLLCGTDAHYGIYPAKNSKHYHYYNCKVCGKYNLEYKELSTVQKIPTIKPYLSSKCRNYNGGMEDGYRIEADDVRIENLALMPETPLEGIDNILIYLSKTKAQNEVTVLDQSNNYPLFYAKSTSELMFWVRTAAQMGLIEVTTSGETRGHRLKIKGWERVKELRSTSRILSKFVFVAKSFHPTLDDLYSNGIVPALRETGFEPIYLNGDLKPGLIDNKIIAGIKQSRFVIADYTLQRAGVYYEAGYATGLGIPVIDCCKRDDFEKIHFDKSHHTIIKWDTPEELKNFLVDAIRANIL